ncbi:hypothetical protein NX059_011001 [Plenodomus lindquistii]|nr:hypothetical protein NX059_011001 [Plenodomus lindquistii]
MSTGPLASVSKPYKHILNTPDNENDGATQYREKTSADTAGASQSKSLVTQCSTCIKIGRILECSQSDLCETCANLDHMVNHQGLDLQVWESHCHDLNKALVARKQQNERESQEKLKVIEETNIARPKLEEHYRRQTKKACSDVSVELKKNLLPLQYEMDKKTQAHDLEELLDEHRNSFNPTNADTIREFFKNKYAQEMDQHFQTYTCMPQEAWQPFLDENNKCIQDLTAQIYSLRQEGKKNEKLIEELETRLKLLHGAWKHQEQESEHRVKSLTDQLQDMQMKRHSQDHRHHVLLDKRNQELSTTQRDVVPEVQKQKAIDIKVSNHLNGAKRQNQANVTEQQVQSSQVQLAENPQHVTNLEHRLPPIPLKQDRQAQEESDYIESLKQQCHEADEADKQLTKLLEGKKAILLRLQSKQQSREANQFVIKEAKDKKKKGKRR